MCERMRMRWGWVAPALLLIGLIGASCQQGVQPVSYEIVLEEGWSLRASAEVGQTGDVLSSETVPLEGWFTTSVPRTVLAALVSNGLYKDPYFGKNIDAIPTSQFEQSWWYRKEFSLEGYEDWQSAQLEFEGINYRANIWLNGKQLAANDEVIGSFRMFSFDVAGLLKEQGNILAVEVFPPRPGELTIGFVDWNPRPPDRNMGLWRPVRLKLAGAVSLRDPFVKTKVNLEPLAEAGLSVETLLVNHSDSSVSSTLELRFEGGQAQKSVSLDPGQTVPVTFTPDEFELLKVQNPRLWWPNNLGDPNLYDLELSVVVGSEISDSRQIRFGIREVGDYINPNGHRGYTVNGQKVLIRGGGWVDDLMLDDSVEKVEAQMKYVRHMNLNTVRLEGFWGSTQALYDLADEYGILLMAGWSCEWEWENYLGKPVDEFGGVETPEEIELITRSLEDQVVWLRNHPSVLVWVFGSDMLPRPALERSYYDALKEIDPTRPTLAACSIRKSEVSGETGVKMNGPYDYVTPNYWYIDDKHGGAYGFNTETGPGPQPPPLESIKRMIPEENLWPIDEMWDFHCGRNEFNTMNRYLNAFRNRYGDVDGVEEFTQWAQVANYEAMRPMLEAFGVNKHNATGVIQWMINSAWPETYWQLYDWYLMPNGAFYGAKTGSDPVNVVYNYGDEDIYVVNDTLANLDGGSVEIRVLNLDSKEIFQQDVDVAVPSNTSTKVFEMPKLGGLSRVYFLDLRLKSSDDQILSRNFYWLSTRKDVLDFENTLWFVTPNKGFADMRPLRNLKKVEVSLESKIEASEQTQTATVTLENRSEQVAFFIELKVVREDTAASVLPVLWDDNYISLLPGEKREIQAVFQTKDLGGAAPQVRMSGPNLVDSGS
ncbi:MAG: glycoside hydrolase family 2 [Acidobacteriota bacterium]|nr:MAG: glycoside hydrolase family 2 [Acidobacteriota bacterium]